MRNPLSNILNKVSEINGIKEDIYIGDIFFEEYNIGTLYSCKFWQIVEINFVERTIKAREISSKVISGDKHKGKLVCTPNKFLKEERLGKIGNIKGNCVINFDDSIVYKLNDINREFTYSH